jgi:hypothetical protein
MSRSYTSSQFEVGGHTRTSKQWEVSPRSPRSPRRFTGKGTPAEYGRPETAKYAGRSISPRPTTAFIADANGHVLASVPKTSGAFSPRPELGSGRHTVRWPKQNSSPKSGMGYKGIATSYMPTNTVKLATVCTKTNTS